MIGSLTCQASCQAFAPSSAAASKHSSGIPLSPPLTTMIQEPTPWKNIIAVRMNGRWPGEATACLIVSTPTACQNPSIGDWPGLSR